MKKTGHGDKMDTGKIPLDNGHAEVSELTPE